MGLSGKKVCDIVEFYLRTDEEETVKTFNIKPATLHRYCRDYAKNHEGKNEVTRSKYLKQIVDNYTDEEIRVIAKGGRILPGQTKVPIYSFSGKTITIGVLGDTHMGSIFYLEDWLNSAVSEFNREKCSMVCHVGDLSEGMSNRSGHIYDLDHIGYDRQRDYCISQMKKIKQPMYMIDGNHDRWFLKSTGALIVKDVCDALPNATYLGHDEGDISLDGRATLRLWHGEDGSSYSVSYRIQKVVESFTGGEKPHVMFLGHVHKQAYIFDRHVHCVSTGCLSKQSKWMRSKRLPAHCGFWIVKITINDHGVGKFSPTWYPFYA